MDLYECRLVLPHYTQHGLHVDHTVQPWLEKALVQKFGGFNAYHSWGSGAMKDGSNKRESGITYDVALSPPDYSKLVLIALGVLRRADQETVYTRDPKGRAWIGANAIELGLGAL